MYGGARHVPLASRPGMRDRTVTLSSTGKTFSFTGWKVGWATGPAPLIARRPARAPVPDVLRRDAAARRDGGLRWIDSQAEFNGRLARHTLARRDLMVDVLRDCRVSPLSVPDGAYFIVCDFRGLSDEDDITFARRLIHEAGVATIPPSAFYARDLEEGRRLLRFAFCKRTETLERAADRLRSWRRR